MAATDATAPTDKDLASIAEARALSRAARQAQTALAELSQQQIDATIASRVRRGLLWVCWLACRSISLTSAG